MQFGQLKLNDSFQFFFDGPVFIKCRDGYRSGRGGALVKCTPSHPVIRFNSMQYKPECVDAALKFKAKYTKSRCKKLGFRDWREALLAAWSQGWDDCETDGGWLRYFRNENGFLWLSEQRIWFPTHPSNLGLMGFEYFL